MASPRVGAATCSGSRGPDFALPAPRVPDTEPPSLRLSSGSNTRAQVTAAWVRLQGTQGLRCLLSPFPEDLFHQHPPASPDTPPASQGSNKPIFIFMPLKHAPPFKTQSSRLLLVKKDGWTDGRMDGGQTDALPSGVPPPGPRGFPHVCLLRGTDVHAEPTGAVFSHERYAQCHWRFLFLFRNTLNLFLQTTIASGGCGATCGRGRAAKEPRARCAAHPSWASGSSHGN